MKKPQFKFRKYKSWEEYQQAQAEFMKQMAQYEEEQRRRWNAAIAAASSPRTLI
jgi:flagellum-specific peptidoglycan hydrolase FlgJ